MSAESRLEEPVPGFERPKLAVIPLAGKATRLRPASLAVPKALFPLIDSDGRAKPTLQLILDEAFGAGIERVCLVTGPGEDSSLQRYLERAFESGDAPWAEKVNFAVQTEPLGFGHAIYCARQVAAGQPVLVLLGDTIYQSYGSARCAAQVLDAAAHCGASTSGVMRLSEAQVGAYGTVRGELVSEGLWRAREIVEKPTAEVARNMLRTVGLPAGTYIGRFGIDAVSGAIFEVLAEDIASDRRERGEFQFTGAQGRLAQREPYFAYQVQGRPLDMGNPDDYLATLNTLASLRKSRAPA